MGDRLPIPSVQAPGDQFQKVPEWAKKKTPDDMRVGFEEESADLQLIPEKPKRPITSKPTGKHHVFTHFPKDPNCGVCKLTKTTRATSRTGPAARGDRSHFDAITADHKVLNGAASIRSRGEGSASDCI